MTGRTIYRAALCLTPLVWLAVGASTGSAADTAFRAGHERWFASWAASPLRIDDAMASIITLSTRRISGQTLRQTVALSRGGGRLRVRFTNEFGSTPLHLGAASIGVDDHGSQRFVPLTFAGSSSAVVPPGAPLLSDPVTMKAVDGERLTISLFLPDDTPVTTAHPVGLDTAYVSGPGDFTRSPELPGAKPLRTSGKGEGESYFSRAFLSEVDVESDQPTRTVIAFGDSITDGFHSTENADRRWPDELGRRIARSGRPLSVTDAGISGNRLLADGAGPSALSRFDRDVVAVPGVSTVIVFEGINDIGFSGGFIPGLRTDVVSVAEMTSGYRQLIARAHGRGLKVIGATMTPFAGSPAYSPQKEKVRRAVNSWILNSRAFDATIDFDGVVRDPRQPGRLAARYDSGDHIHPNDAGYAAMAKAIDISAL